MLEINNLSISYNQKKVVKNITLSMKASEIVGIVGESGSGKSTLINSILGILGKGGQVTGGEILFQGESLLHLSPKEMGALRGSEISLISQYPEQSMDPVFPIGNQMIECMRYHRKITKGKAIETAVTLFGELGFQNPEKLLSLYPFELSGGMSQRVSIAMALSNHAKLLLADEPTSALDVTIQAQVVDLMMNMKEKYKMAVLIVSHNIGVIAKMADKIGVMYQGELVEFGNKDDILRRPVHDYTKMLLDAIPKL